MLFSKKSQIHAQIFIYIIAIILFSFILIYGYNAIKGFKDRSEQISYIKFKTDLISAVERVSPDYGTVKREEFFIGGEYKQVCFVQSYEKEENFDSIEDSITNPLIKDSFESGADKNVFLLTDTLQESFDVGKIYADGGYLCINIINGKARIELLGQGDHTIISTYSD